MKVRGFLMEWLLVAVAVAAAIPIALAASGSLHKPAMVARANAGTASAAPPALPRFGDPLGELQIPRLSLTVPVKEGCSSETLERGTCRMIETAQIGGLGTVAIAGHRDAAFHALAGVRKGDLIRASGQGGNVFQYIVDSTRVVTPEQVDVVATADRPMLVLITCYPFGFLGKAPKRFIVQAHLRLGETSE